MKLSGSFYALAVFCTSAWGAALDTRANLSIKLYEQTNYRGTPYSAPFRENTCTRLPRLHIFPFRSVRIPEDYDCFFYAQMACQGDPDMEAYDSVPDIRERTTAALQSFKCEPSS
ncbi:hypothetical protein M413DRAFT_443860 [Hebeloma cylindrosporum]|uniref:OTU domain-containing protein n=1 Tax=Hebeloma cylindrosporum TaxID=76867 RepID=A0A0C3C279_HEBCY|nr:hypothetical protein M413DRAFT_443860 [Hebeloma cylindrosporum h7]